MKRLPPLPALHTFLITAQCCNFTHAGEQLHITQGAVSRQIAGLEAHLGYPLFHRLARGLSLTEQGQALYPRIEQVFDLIGEAVEYASIRRSPLQIKAPTCMLRWLLPKLMQWQKLRPDVPVELTSSVQHGVDFRHEAFDAAVVYSPQPGPKRVGQHLFEELLTPVCAPHLLEGRDALNSLSQLEHHTLLHPSRDQRDWAHWLSVAGADASIIRQSQYFDTLDLAMTVAAQGNGVAMGDWSLIGDDLQAGRLAVPFDLKVHTGAAYLLVSSPRSEPTAPLRELMEWLVLQAEKQP
ncbi:LysR substrate-binding domain-containing protein [Pseudomonas sp. NPDC096917]|uniref:LysR substrate-binding domain-containing protein n=1 Tax=Pseudomonas sp. NPDC096917 TaxID=3364483 RepID=UPI00383A0FF4